MLTLYEKLIIEEAFYSEISMPLTNINYSFAMQAFIVNRAVCGIEYYEKRDDVRNKLKHQARCERYFINIVEAAIEYTN